MKIDKFKLEHESAHDYEFTINSTSGVRLQRLMTHDCLESALASLKGQELNEPEYVVQRFLKGTGITAGIAARIYPKPMESGRFEEHNEADGFSVGLRGPFDWCSASSFAADMPKELPTIIVDYGWGFNIATADNEMTYSSMFQQVNFMANMKSQGLQKLQSLQQLIADILQVVEGYDQELSEKLLKRLDALEGAAICQYLEELEVITNALDRKEVLFVGLDGQRERHLYTTKSIDSVQYKVLMDTADSMMFDEDQIDDYGFVSLDIVAEMMVSNGNYYPMIVNLLTAA